MVSVESVSASYEMNSYTLVLLRHGQSLWNLENRFTGWAEIDLTDAGRQEAVEAGRRLANAGLAFDRAFTSVLRRAWETLDLVLNELQIPNIPIQRAWELNERHYGCLQGLSKSETARRLGEDRVIDWRRGFTGCPPALEFDDHRHPRFDPLYAGFLAGRLPCTESLKDTVARLLPFWQSSIVPEIHAGARMLIVAHGNSLRALVKHLEETPEAEFPALQVPTGIPIIYQLDRTLKPISRRDLV